jgi:hypothetical protein
LGINVQIFDSTSLISTYPSIGGLSGPGVNLDYSAFALDYVGFGAWLYDQSGGTGRPRNSTFFMFGYETPAASMPLTGTATYSTDNAVTGIVITSQKLTGAAVGGGANFNVNFTTGAITGQLVNMKSYGDGTVYLQPWQTVNINASIVSGTADFSGTTSSVPNAAAPFELKDATGTIDGGFYGPNAENLGALWTLKGSNGTAFGVVGTTAGP